MLGAQGEALRVAAGEGAVDVLRMQAAGGPELPGAEFLERVLGGRRPVFDGIRDRAGR
ncbi:MAG: hypothetical protein ACE147_20885 [Candidatus Methylomirabilales bacterium]